LSRHLPHYFIVKHEVTNHPERVAQKLVFETSRHIRSSEVCSSSQVSISNSIPYPLVQHHRYPYPTDSFTRYDVSPLWANPAGFSALINDIETHFRDVQYDLVIALDALGFILGGALATSSHKGLVPLRKGGKLPLPEDRLASVRFTDYDETEKRFEIVKDLVKPGMHAPTILDRA
jgi:hypothetical protein